MAITRLAVSIGCPSGIGPEVSVAAAATLGGAAKALLIGDEAVLVRAAKAVGVPVSRLWVVDRPTDAWKLEQKYISIWQPGPALSAANRTLGKPSPAGGAAQLAWIDAACDLVEDEKADALVTGPVSKAAIASSGAKGAAEFLGHTEHLQRRLHARSVVMAFWSKELTTALVTTHLPLAQVAGNVTREGVMTATYWLARFLGDLGLSRPRIAVASLNPHAGEGGLLGLEEAKRLVPGIQDALSHLLLNGRRAEIVGPVPAETAFRLAVQKQFDGVVAMYHDQATIPMKLVGFGEAVNVSLALPIIRTSVDHGTAYDRAGKGTADPRGMKEAMVLAVRLSKAHLNKEAAP